jgi:hypothetical protein
LNYFNYFSEIEETFIRRRGRNLFLSPLDWALIEDWQEREIPLHIILRSIEKVFDGYDAKPKKHRSVKSLMYCREEIEAQYEEWLESQVGKAAATEENGDGEAAFSERTISEHLENICTDLEKIRADINPDLAEILSRTAKRLSDLKNKFGDPESLETDLASLEKLIDEGLLTRSEPEMLTRLCKETAGELETYRKTMTADAYQKTFDLLLLKKLRLETGIPRLSLFYL